MKKKKNGSRSKTSGSINSVRLPKSESHSGYYVARGDILRSKSLIHVSSNERTDFEI